jgi:catechol 2,3-dioxygenase-like lactoylglutathione lyase family enzyme
MADSSVEFNHVAVVNRSREEAESFYGGVLGLVKLYEFTVTSGLAAALFGFSGGMDVLVYGCGGMKLEIFITPECTPPRPPVPHICVQVKNRDSFLARAGRDGVEVISGDNDGNMVYFLRDFAGNRVEVKEA